MAESRIKDENYYQIQGWMINRLGLKGVTLSVYAIIYGFTQDGENEFTGSLQYLCDFCGGVSKPTIIKSLKDLVDYGYLLRREEVINGVQFNRYKANLPLLKNLYYPDKETLTGVVKNFNGGGKETLPNNNIYNSTKHKKEDKEERKKAAEGSFDRLIYDYVTGSDGVSYRFHNAEEIINLLRDWLKVRKAKRAAMTDRAIELNLQKLDKLAQESKLSVADYLKEVICRGWQAFYPIQTYNQPAANKQERGGNVFLDLIDDEEAF